MFDTDRSVLLGLCGLSIVLVFSPGCEQKPKDPEPQAATPTDSSSRNNGTSTPDYPDVYCQALPKLKIKQNPDLLESINIFCANGRATPELRSFIQAATAAPDDSKEPTKIYDKKNVDYPDGWSEYIYLWSFTAPIQPADIKNRPIVETLASGYSSGTTQLTTKATPLGIESLDDTGFHLKSAKMEYALRISGENDLKVEHSRTTEFNIYQVGSSEMGFSEEHMIDSQNPHYKYSTMINFSLKDGRPGKNGSVVVSLLHINIFNQGSPSVAKNTAANISRYLAESLYKALR